MRLLSLIINAEPNTTPQDFVKTLLDWLNTNKYISFSNTELNEILNLNSFTSLIKSFNNATSWVQFRRFSHKETRYFALRLENHNTDNNFNWIVDTVFVQAETVSEQGTFHITLQRKPLRNNQPSDISLMGYPPYILNLLAQKRFITRSNDSPWIYLDKATVDSRPEVSEYIEKHLSPLIGFNITDQSSSSDIAMYIQSPKMIRNIDYSFDEFNSDSNAIINRINVDIFRILNETQHERALSWEDLEALLPSNNEIHYETDSDSAPQLTKYCYMNEEMAEKIKMRRKNMGLSQNELAQIVNSSGLIISRLETRRVQRVLKSTLNNIEAALNLPLNSIVSMQYHMASKQTVAPDDKTKEQNQNIDSTPSKSGYCRYCGSELYSDSVFCSHCGTKVLK